MNSVFTKIVQSWNMKGSERHVRFLLLLTSIGLIVADVGFDYPLSDTTKFLSRVCLLLGLKLIVEQFYVLHVTTQETDSFRDALAMLWESSWVAQESYGELVNVLADEKQSIQTLERKAELERIEAQQLLKQKMERLKHRARKILPDVSESKITMVAEQAVAMSQEQANAHFRKYKQLSELAKSASLFSGEERKIFSDHLRQSRFDDAVQMLQDRSERINLIEEAKRLGVESSIDWNTPLTELAQIRATINVAQTRARHQARLDVLRERVLSDTGNDRGAHLANIQRAQNAIGNDRDFRKAIHPVERTYGNHTR